MESIVGAMQALDGCTNGQGSKQGSEPNIDDINLRFRCRQQFILTVDVTVRPMRGGDNIAV